MAKDIDINIRSIFYAIGLQFCCPGLGRLYLKEWGIGIFQLLIGPIGMLFFCQWLRKDIYIIEDWKIGYFFCISILGLIWSWIDGYFIATHPLKIRTKKITLVYHNIKSNSDLLTKFQRENRNRSPLIASALQLCGFGLGRIYMGSWIVGLFQFGFLILSSILSRQVDKLNVSNLLWLVCILWLLKLFILGYSLFDSYSILKYYGANFNSKDKFIGGMLQMSLPGLGRCYLGYWWIGILQFLSSFILIGLIWSWIDGHRILFDPNINKDEKGESLTDLYRV